MHFDQKLLSLASVLSSDAIPRTLGYMKVTPCFGKLLFQVIHDCEHKKKPYLYSPALEWNAAITFVIKIEGPKRISKKNIKKTTQKSYFR